MSSDRTGVTVLAAAALALGVLATASAQPLAGSKYGGTLVVGISGDADSLDPTISRSLPSRKIYLNICQRLYEYDTGGKMQVEPLLAAGMPVVSEDKLSYTVQLRRGVEFNDGTPFNAQAVVTSIQRFMTYPGSVLKSDYASVESVTASGPYTVVYRLKARDSAFTAAMGQSYVLSPTQLAKPGVDFATSPVCVGPFMYDHRVAGDNVTVVKSPYYYDRKHVYVDKIVYKPMPDGPSAAAALKAGDIQVRDSVSTTELPGTSVRVLRGNTPSWLGIYINIGNKNGLFAPYTNVGTPLARSPMLRQAFAEAIDRDVLARVVFGGLVVPSCTMISPSNTAWFDGTKVPCTPYDPKHAKALVTRAGYANPTVHLLVRNATGLVRVATFIQAQEAAVGINVVIDTAETTAELARAVAGEFDTRLSGWTPGGVDPHGNIYQFLVTGQGRNYSGYSSSRMDLILNNAIKATSFQARATLYRAAQQLLLTERPVIVLYSDITFAGVSASVTGVRLTNGLAFVENAQFK